MDLVREASRELVKALGNKIVAIALFGSRARKEASCRGDYDFFVVVRNFRDKNRRFKIYHHLHKVLKSDITVVDVDEERLFNERLSITPLLLNVAWDAEVLCDPSGRLEELFERIRKAAKEKLVRYRTKDGKYGWKPKNGKLEPMEV